MQSHCKLTSGSSGNNATMVIKDGSWKAIGGPATMNPRSASEGRADNRSHPYPQHAFGSNELGIHGTGGYHAQGMGAAAADSLTKLVGAFAAATPIFQNMVNPHQFQEPCGAASHQVHESAGIASNQAHVLAAYALDTRYGPTSWQGSAPNTPAGASMASSGSYATTIWSVRLTQQQFGRESRKSRVP